MLSFLETAIQPLQSNQKILEAAYELYLQAPQDSHPLINLRDLARQTGMSVFDCRNAIISANKAGKFPNCSLAT